MPNFDDQDLSLAKVYASSMMALAKERGEEDPLGEELAALAAMLDSDPTIVEYLSSPTVNEDRRRELLEKMFRGRASDLLVDSLQVLNRNGRLGLVAAVEHAYHAMFEEWRGRVEVSVRAAAPLSPPQQARLREVIKKKTGKEADLMLELDTGLIGGLVVQIGDQKLDASVRRKLETIAMALSERASRELQQVGRYVDGAAV